MFTVTMPPPEEPSTRISATSSCIFCCIFWACCIMACMLPGIFMGFSNRAHGWTARSGILQISDRADLRVLENILKALHYRMRERTSRGFIFALRRSGYGGRGGGVTDLNRDSNRPSGDALGSGFEFGLLQIQLIHFRRGEYQFVGRLGQFGVLQRVGYV